MRLGQSDAQMRRVALVLSTYPGKDYQMAHAVGLDALASAEAILADLAQAGYDVGPKIAPLADALTQTRLAFSLADYQQALAGLSPALQANLTAAWGAPQ